MGEQAPPAFFVPAPASMGIEDQDLIRLTREIAMDIRPLPDILEKLNISNERYESLAAMPQFQKYLRTAVDEWQSATNTPERVRIKSLAFVEEALPEFYARAHDPKESLAAKTEVLKTVSRFAGLGGAVQTGQTGERMTVTINLGTDHQLRIERDITPTYEAEDRL
jgi:hypothetical protein